MKKNSYSIKKPKWGLMALFVVFSCLFVNTTNAQKTIVRAASPVDTNWTTSGNWSYTVYAPFVTYPIGSGGTTLITLVNGGSTANIAVGDVVTGTNMPASSAVSVINSSTTFTINKATTTASTTGASTVTITAPAAKTCSIATSATGAADFINLTNDLNYTANSNYYFRRVANTATTAAADMTLSGAGILTIDNYSDQFYTFGGTIIANSNTSGRKFTIDSKIKVNNTYTIGFANRNNVLQCAGNAANVLEFGPNSVLENIGNGIMVTWPSLGTVLLNGEIKGASTFTCGQGGTSGTGATGYTTFGATSNNPSYNLSTNSISIASGAYVTVNTQVGNTFFKNTAGGKLTLNAAATPAALQSSTTIMNTANVWSSILRVSTASGATGANLIINADQTANVGAVEFANATSILNLTVASGKSVNFGNSSANTWPAGAVFNIYGIDNANIKFGVTNGGLTSTQLAMIVIKDGVNAGGTVTLDATGRLIADNASVTTITQLSSNGTDTITQACGGSTLVILGTNFTGSPTVTVNGVALTGVTVVSSTRIDAVLPMGTTNGLVEVSNANGSGKSAGNFTVNAIPSTPTISAGSTTTLCSGESVTLTSNAASGNQWYKDGVLIVGATATTYSATTSGSYTVISTVNGCSSSASAGTTVTVTANVTPTFTAIATICPGGSLSALPTTSNNGFTGTWSPALNNTATTTYTFTPSAGQCATSTTLTITVKVLPTPTFDAVAAICYGGTLSALPTISNNGYTGSWSPALNNTATTTYTFTPTSGQCATSTTLTITVNALPTPPTVLCYQTATWNGATCQYDITGSQPTKPAADVTNVTICSGETYTWSVNSLEYSSTQTVTITNNDCTANQVLNLTVTPSSDHVTTISACDSYTWANNSQNYTSTGVYTGTTTNCVTEKLDLTITPSSNNTTTITSLNSYTWSVTGQIYTTSGIKTGSTINCVTELLNLTINSTLGAPVVADSAICKGDAGVSPTATALPGYSLVWYTTLTGKSPLSAVPVVSTATKTYWVAQKSGATISDRAAVTVTVNPLPLAPSTVELKEGATAIKKVGNFIGSTTSLTLTATPNGVADHYKWTLPAGVNVVSGSKDTDASITINLADVPSGTTSLAFSVVSVSATNCSSSAKTLTVSASVPGKPKTLVLTDGDSAAIKKLDSYTGALKGRTLTLTAGPNLTAGSQATSYKWVLPVTVGIVSGSATLVSTDLGFSTYTSESNVISINLAGVTNETSFVFKVYGVNGNGISLLSKDLTCTSAAPKTPGSITKASPAFGTPTFNNTCNSSITVQVPSVLGMTYTWSVGGGASIVSGDGSNSIIINTAFVTTPKLSISVTASNGTGPSYPRILSISKVTACRIAPEAAPVADEFNVIAYPNPSSSEFTIDVQSSAKGTIGVQVFDMAGRLIENRQVQSNSVEVGRNYPSGVYNVIVNQGVKVKTLRVIKR